MQIHDSDLDDEFEINILPMIDVIFAILAFFIVSTLFLTRTEGLSVNLPQSDTAQPQTPADFTITISANGEILLDQTPVTEESLPTRITEQLEPNQTAQVTIRADERTYHGQVIAVMDKVREIDGASLGIATTRESKEAASSN